MEFGEVGRKLPENSSFNKENLNYTSYEVVPECALRVPDLKQFHQIMKTWILQNVVSIHLSATIQYSLPTFNCIMSPIFSAHLSRILMKIGYWNECGSCNLVHKLPQKVTKSFPFCPKFCSRVCLLLEHSSTSPIDAWMSSILEKIQISFKSTSQKFYWTFNLER